MATYVSSPSYAISSVDIGIEEASATGGSQPISVILYTSSANPPTLATLSSPLAIANVTVTNQNLTLLNVPISAVVSSSSILVVEVSVPDGTANSNRFVIGSNAAGQSGPSYFRSAPCAINDITDTATLGFPNMDLVMRVNGSCTIPTATATVTGTPPTATRTITSTATRTSTATVTITATRTSTATSTITATRTATLTSVAATATGTATSAPPTVTRTATTVPLTATSTPTVTRTPCPITFSDVTDPTAYYYTPVYYLACRGVVSGYSDGTFRPFNNTTRGQMAKIVVLAESLPLQTPAAGGYTFTDAPPTDTFYTYIETAVVHSLIGGYACGGVNPQSGATETCDGANRPYYRGGNFVTRGQLTKIVVGAAVQIQGWTLLNPATASFSDVPVGSTFFRYIETAVCHHVLGGYSDGTFRPNDNAFRGQIAKIVYNTVTDTTTGCP
jgi:hypothetical protein